MGKRRNSAVELCFDSMTDLITNLAGGLILVVLLLLGITRDAPTPVTEVKAPVKKGSLTDEKSIRPLQDRVNQLRLETDAANRDIRLLNQRLPELEMEVDNLVAKSKTGSTAPPKK